MRAIVLSAGQGRRLLPLTARDPKCLLRLDTTRSLLEAQLAVLARCGIERASVVVGFGASRVERLLATTLVPGIQVDTLWNPFYASSDNLVSCWLARHLMDGDFVLLNGDTVFEDALLRRLLAAPPGIAVAVDHKDTYDDDDMKVAIAPDGRLLGIGKALEAELVCGESVGSICFRGAGPKLFQDVLDRSIRRPDCLRAWYLSAVHEIAQDFAVDTVSMRGLWWREIDSLADLREARASLRRRSPVAGAAECGAVTGQ